MTTEPNLSSQKPAPWGVLIGILLVLVVIVAGAYYAFTDRITPDPATSTAVSY